MDSFGRDAVFEPHAGGNDLFDVGVFNPPPKPPPVKSSKNTAADTTRGDPTGSVGVLSAGLWGRRFSPPYAVDQAFDETSECLGFLFHVRQRAHGLRVSLNASPGGRRDPLAHLHLAVALFFSLKFWRDGGKIAVVTQNVSLYSSSFFLFRDQLNNRFVEQVNSPDER